MFYATVFICRRYVDLMGFRICYAPYLVSHYLILMKLLFPTMRRSS